MLIVTGKHVEGHKIIEHKDLVFGVGNSATAGDKYRDEAIKKAAEAAKAIGANAIINAHFEIHKTDGGYEATVYGDAVMLEYACETNGPSKKEKINYSNFITSNLETKASEFAEIIDMNGFKFIVCPKCKSKYKADIDEAGNVRIKGFDDVDDDEPGLQIFCIRCGTKFTVPDSI